MKEISISAFKGREKIIKKSLLEYCKQDTLAMVRLHKHLYQLI